MAALAGMSEAGGGALLFLGLLTPFGAAAVIGTMLVASISVHKDNGLWASNGGYELPFFYAVVAAGLAFTGPGSFSVDNGLGLNLSGWAWGLLALVLAGVGAGIQLSRRKRAVASDGATADESAYPADEAPTTVASDEAMPDRAAT